MPSGLGTDRVFKGLAFHSVVMVAPRRAMWRAYLRRAQEGGRYAAARATIHVFLCQKKSWMLATSASMTAFGAGTGVCAGRSHLGQNP
jgi:hypothetical protein